MNDPVLGILFALGGYFLGGIMFSDIFPRVFMKKDIKSLSDDKNPGASNVFKICGIPMGILCLFLDMAKGFLPVFLFMLLGGTDSFVFPLYLYPLYWDMRHLRTTVFTEENVLPLPQEKR